MTKSEQYKARSALKEAKRAARQLGYSKEIRDNLANITTKLSESYNTVMTAISRQMVNGRNAI